MESYIRLKPVDCAQMIPIGLILFFAGLLAMIVGELMFLVLAYKRSLIWFFGCLFVPIVCWIFLFLNLKAAMKPFAIQVGGLLLLLLGGHFAGII